MLDAGLERSLASNLAHSESCINCFLPEAVFGRIQRSCSGLGSRIKSTHLLFCQGVMVLS